MKILAPAKINLFLHVTSKRSDGYHNLVTLMCCISLYDSVLIQTTSRDIKVICSHPEVPEDASNLAAKAANLFFRCLTRKPGYTSAGVEIKIDKKIPVGAGLGGGSSDAAAVLSGLNVCYHNPFTQNELAQMGATIGADVPFFIFQKPALASGIGERLEAYEKLTPLQVAVIFPGVNVSTAEVYNNLNLRLTKCEKKLKELLLKKVTFNIEHHLCNDLETVAIPKIPEIKAIKKMLSLYGAEGTLMSGSGSSVFGLFRGHAKALSARAAIEKEYDWQVFIADMLL